MKIYSPDQLSAMADYERKAVLEGEFGRSFHVSAAEHVAWIFWTRDTEEPAASKVAKKTADNHEGSDTP
jgi:hypothetical protein